MSKQAASFSFLCLVLSWSAQALSQATYSYTGVNPMANANGVYTGAEVVSVTFTIPEPLPAGATTDVSSTITSLNASDGFQTLTEVNVGRLAAEFTTDADGNIETWIFAVEPDPLPTVLGDPFTIIRTGYATNGTLFDAASLGTPCNVDFPSPCRVGIGDYGNIGDSATTLLITVARPSWTLSYTPPAQPVPTMPFYALLGAILGVVMLALARPRAFRA